MTTTTAHKFNTEPMTCPWCKGIGLDGSGNACGCDGGYLPGVVITEVTEPTPAMMRDALERQMAAKVVAQLNAARLPGEKCEYVIDVAAPDMVSLTVTFRGVVHAEPAWCETGMTYTEDGLLDADKVARTHSNTKFRLTKKLTKKYAR